MSASGSLESGERQSEDNQPRQGLVNQVCREWLVHEDSALAYRLQEKEIEMHYCKNREQRQLIRTDLRQAHNLHEDVIRDIVEGELRRDAQDAELAMKLQERIEKEESVHNRILEKADKELAKKIQEAETSTHKKRYRDHKSPIRETLPNITSPKKNLAACYEDTLVRATKNMSVDTPTTAEAASARSGSTSPSNGFSLLADVENEIDVNLVPSLAKVHEQRLLQEVKDQEIALALQQAETNPKTLQYYLDQKLAIEAQDHELAILLQEKERQRAKKARQKHRLQKSKTQEEKESERTEEYPSDYRPKPRRATSYFDPHEVQRRRQEAEMAEAMASHSRATLASTESPRRRQERSESHLQRSPNDELPNVAMVLDPTYRSEMKSPDELPQPTGIFSPVDIRHTPYNEDESSEDDYSAPDEFVAAPPYMPIQGQKRLTLEKKKKKDNCKQQ